MSLPSYMDLESSTAKQLRAANYRTVEDLEDNFIGVYEDWEAFVREEIENTYSELYKLAYDSTLTPSQRRAVETARLIVSEYTIADALAADYQAFDLESGRVLIMQNLY